MKRFWIIIFFCSCSAFAQDSLTHSAKIMLDSALGAMNMTRSDLWLPPDVLPNDAHRLPLITKIFTNPLSGVDTVKKYAGLLHLQSPSAFFKEILPEIRLGNYKKSNFKKEFTPHELDSALGISLDTLGHFAETVAIRSFLSAIVQAHDEILSARLSVDSNSFKLIAERVDSLLLMSEESQNASPFELQQDEEQAIEMAKKFFATTAQAIDGSKISKIHSTGFSLYEYLTELISAVLTRDLQPLYGAGFKTTILETKYGRIAIGGAGDDVYEGDFLFILDIGGNDRYILPDYSKNQALKKPITVIIDLKGDDTYSGGDFSLGSGIFGASLLIDCAGNDHYIAKNFSLASGVFGVGILDDYAGNDSYSGGTCCEGSGVFGVGLLIDRAGHDVYTCAAQSQGFGYTRGCGAIADFNGNDSYITSSPFQDFLRYDSHFVAFTQGAALGYRPIASGGIGLLCDFAGNDSYLTDIYGQGTAYWLGLGGLYDMAGDDRYQAYQYAQGAGIHFAHGLLIDEAGNDHYSSHGVSQGCGHDIGVGALIDSGGDDEYFAESLSLGGGNANAISIFLDESGDDAYIARNTSNTMGFSDFRRDYGLIGIFIDGGGKDLYGETTRNNSMTTKSTFGVFADFDLVPNVPQDNSQPALTPTKDKQMPLADGLDSLFVQATTAPQKYQYLVRPAEDKIVNIGAKALPFLAKKLGTEFPRERLALEYLMPKFFEKDSVATLKLLLDSLQSPNEITVGNCAFTLGRKKSKQSLPIFAKMLKSSNWHIRAMSAKTIGEIGGEEYSDSLAVMLHDKETHVRMRAAFTLGQFLPDFPLNFSKIQPKKLPKKKAKDKIQIVALPKPAIPACFSGVGIIRSTLKDTSQLVRHNFVQGIIRKNKLLAPELLFGVLDSLSDQRSKKIWTQAFAVADTSVLSQKFLRTKLPKLAPDVRKSAENALSDTGKPVWKVFLAGGTKNKPKTKLKLKNTKN